MRYWINTISRAHVERGVAGGFTQSDHGKATRLKRLSKGDRIIFYSPRTDYPDGAPLQCFTAIGTIVDDEPFQVEISSDWKPWRRRVDFVECSAVAIQPLIASLDFLPDKKNWGIVFRRGLFEIGGADFGKIETAMKSAGAAANVISHGHTAFLG